MTNEEAITYANCLKNNYTINFDDMADFCDMAIKALGQESKIGHWIDTGSSQECSECGEMQYGYDNFRFYCANCGCRIERSDEK